MSQEQPSGVVSEGKGNIDERARSPAVVISERPKRNSVAMLDPETPTGTPTSSRKRRQSVVAKKRYVNKQGETIFKGHRSYDLMLNIQLGIRVAVGQITPKPSREINRERDFSESVKLSFPREGSHLTPSHPSHDFKFKDYCPMVWRHLREKFSIDAGEYMVSICGDKALSELSTPGKSGALFLFSHDMSLILKTVSKDESKFLRQILPAYYDHVMTNPNTLLTRYFGMYRVKPSGGKKVRFVVMNNIFDTEKYIFTRFDLKGSTVGRKASEADKQSPTVVLKDLDFETKLFFGAERKQLFLEQVERDCKFLESTGIMDYSLLLGVHYLDRGIPEHVLRQEAVYQASRNADSPVSPIGGGSGIGAGIEMAGSSSGEPSVGVSVGEVELDVDGSQGKAPAEPLAPISATGSSSRNVAKFLSPQHIVPKSVSRPYSSLFQTDEGGIQAMNEDGSPRPEIYYLGIIDLLQQWDFRKQAEHALKSLRYSGDGISAVEPKQYAERFRSFLSTLIV